MKCSRKPLCILLQCVLSHVVSYQEVQGLKLVKMWKWCCINFDARTSPVRYGCFYELDLDTRTRPYARTGDVQGPLKTVWWLKGLVRVNFTFD